MSESQTPNSIAQEPINVLFDPKAVVKKDVWEIDLIQILNLLAKILEKTGRKDLKVAGMAALSSSLIYRMKVESIFALQKAAMEKKPSFQRTDVDIELIDIPYRHESTYPVSLDDLLGYSKRHRNFMGKSLFLKGKKFKEEILHAKSRWHFIYKIHQSLSHKDGKIVEIDHHKLLNEVEHD